MTTGKSRGLALPVGAAGMLLVQEECGDEVLLLAQSNRSRWLVSDGQR
jgi:hypothetical protein